MTVFVDTSAFYAAADESDRSHDRATEVLSSAGPLITSDHVLLECWTLIRARGGRDAAERFWATLRRGSATLEMVLANDLDLAWQIGEQFPDQDFSIVERTSFAIMQRLGITSVASFDDHFAIYRFGPRRERAFDVKR